MPVSLTKTVGKTTSKSVKKWAVYLLAAYVAISSGSMFYTFLSIWSLSREIMGKAPRAVLLIFIMYLPVILWFILRAVYKYQSAKWELEEERERNGLLWDIMNGGRKEILEKINKSFTVVKDGGTFGANLDKDLEEIDLYENRQ